MTKRNNERINRNLAITLVVMANSIVWSTLTAFVAAWNKFSSLNNDAQTAADKAEQQIKGWAINKKNARRTMADAAIHIKGAVQAYAKSIGDMELFKAIDFSHTKITQGRSVVALERSYVIYNRANAIISLLTTFGVTAATLSDFQTLMATYQNLISAPINAKEARKTYNKQISDILNLADDALKNEVAKLMENFRTSAPSFYQQFFNDLRLMHGATNFTEIKAMCRNTDTGTVLPGVLLTITNPRRTYTVTSDYTGTADKKSMEPGTYRLIFTKSGFRDYILENIHIGLSEYETFTVNMLPS